MSHEGANVTALVDSCNVVYHSQNVKEVSTLTSMLEARVHGNQKEQTNRRFRDN